MHLGRLLAVLPLPPSRLPPGRTYLRGISLSPRARARTSTPVAPRARAREGPPFSPRECLAVAPFASVNHGLNKIAYSRESNEMSAPGPTALAEAQIAFRCLLSPLVPPPAPYSCFRRTGDDSTTTTTTTQITGRDSDEKCTRSRRRESLIRLNERSVYHFSFLGTKIPKSVLLVFSRAVNIIHRRRAHERTLSDSLSVLNALRFLSFQLDEQQLSVITL